MSKFDDIKAQIAEIKDATANVAADLVRIADTITGGLTSDEADSVVAELTDAATALRAVADVNPEPPAPVTPE